MNPLGPGLIVWTVMFALILGWAFTATDGEPVCQGPLIVSVDDSDPPTCNTPVEGLWTIGPRLYAAGLIPTVLTSAVITRRQRAKGLG